MFKTIFQISYRSQGGISLECPLWICNPWPGRLGRRPHIWASVNIYPRGFFWICAIFAAGHFPILMMLCYAECSLSHLFLLKQVEKCQLFNMKRIIKSEFHPKSGIDFKLKFSKKRFHFKNKSYITFISFVILRTLHRKQCLHLFFV